MRNREMTGCGGSYLTGMVDTLPSDIGRNRTYHCLDPETINNSPATTSFYGAIWQTLWLFMGEYDINGPKPWHPCYLVMKKMTTKRGFWW